MVDVWVRRYQEGESLKQIAADLVDSVTVWNHLRARGVVLRDKVEAQIKAVTKHERRSFSGDALDRAYLIGLRYGDFDVVRHGRAIRVRVSTTHPAMAELFESLFSSYGHVAKYPRRDRLTGHEWNLECDLDASFEFLLKKPAAQDLEALDLEEFLAFLAGFFDAEGSIYLHKKSNGWAPELSITNTERQILELVGKRIEEIGVRSSLNEYGQGANRLGYLSEGRIHRLQVWQIDSVRGLLKRLGLRHEEKVSKAKIALLFESPLNRVKNHGQIRSWKSLSKMIEYGRVEFMEKAKEVIRHQQGDI